MGVIFSSVVVLLLSGVVLLLIGTPEWVAELGMTFLIVVAVIGAAAAGATLGDAVKKAWRHLRSSR